jgi:ubiquinol-cytochrome c reductase cytochrome b subunit
MYKLFSEYFIYSGLPSNISYAWNFGSLLGIVLGLQIVSGVFLGMHYAANIDLSFILMENIMRNVQYGWIIRYMHSNGAAIFFILMYSHIARGLYNGSYSYPRFKLWNIGVIIYILSMGTAFIGYCLPFGQMSIWGATVITNFISTIPYLGNDLVIFVWGGFSVANPTLNRFFSLHYLLPFILLALVLLHMMALHEHASSNPLGISGNMDKVYFHPYFTLKDSYTLIILIIFYCILIFYFPNYLGHPDNYIPANPLVTPLSIVPEFYFLAPYAILRIIPSKILGLIALILSLLVLFVLPLQSSYAVRSLTIKNISKLFYFIFIGSYLILVFTGALPISEEVISLASIAAFYYFFYLLIIIPLISLIDSLLFYSK